MELYERGSDVAITSNAKKGARFFVFGRKRERGWTSNKNIIIFKLETEENGSSHCFDEKGKSDKE